MRAPLSWASCPPLVILMPQRWTTMQDLVLRPPQTFHLLQSKALRQKVPKTTLNIRSTTSVKLRSRCLVGCWAVCPGRMLLIRKKKRSHLGTTPRQLCDLGNRFYLFLLTMYKSFYFLTLPRTIFLFFQSNVRTLVFELNKCGLMILKSVE